MKVAALDLGTNSFLCLIGEGDRSGLKSVTSDLMEIVRLGQDVNKTKQFHPEALLRAKSCLERFRQEIDKHGVDKIQAVATSAARDVKNSHELFDICARLNIPVTIIKGSDEARISFAGATWGHQLEDQNLAVIDVGGGSTEYIIGHSHTILYGHSLDIGGVRLTEKCISEQPVPPEQKRNLEDVIDSEVSKIIGDLKKHSFSKLIAVAGTPTSLASIEVGGFDEEKIDGYYFSLERLQYWESIFRNTTIEEKKLKFNLGGRADIIYAGLSILIKSVVAMGLDGLYVSTKGVRYGVAQEVLSGRSL